MSIRCGIAYWIISAALIIPGLSLSAEQIALDALIGKLPTEAVTDFEDDGIAFRWDRAGIGMALAPDRPEVTRIRQEHTELEPDILVEGIYLIPYPDNSRDIDLRLYNALRRVSSISNVKYFSARRNALVPLFDKVYRFEEQSPNKALPDSQLSSIPNYDQIYLKMKEINLGPAEYKAQYLYSGDSLSFILKNMTPLRVLFKVVDSSNMLIHILVFPTENGYFVYGYCSVRLSNPRFVDRLMDPWSSFYKRLYAMVVWVENTLHGTDKLPVMGERLGF